ncbi:hypothetical protein PHYSODRAFT_343892 [Phytophthora sojae]|uniref:Uncharacterized protein n=1 Tax=Phytophthora sojae (strain P6497) TaxID=1094619 RepID=G4YMF0_PHYSP|nr:hypothetical protein PHYSODRAFT_343892 [Phytophthora sojae]EGZ28576.1 hypothetical protein PHYSODRAFT_343892 [Phytophthora sojae]|eukprot:XP_009515851.1 hypothetical protein PHYSODRAFT_343892 [Phytophthora sojae]
MTAATEKSHERRTTTTTPTQPKRSSCAAWQDEAQAGSQTAPPSATPFASRSGCRRQIARQALASSARPTLGPRVWWYLHRTDDTTWIEEELWKEFRAAGHRAMEAAPAVTEDGEAPVDDDDSRSSALPLGINSDTMDRVKREAYGEDGHGHRREEEHVAPLTKESEPWRGSSGFGLANILNRSSSGAPTSTMPQFSLPSLHSFGKPLLTKPEVSLAPQHYEEENQYVATRQQLQQQQQQRSADSSPARQTSPSPNSRRIAPAPADEEEAEQEAENTPASTRSGGAATQSIRGGRWTADEHERFLEGFRIHGHKWKRVQQVVRTRSVTQVRTHAQKYLLKVAKLKAEKKQGAKTAEMTTLAAEQPSTATAAAAAGSVDGSNTAPSTPEHGANNDSPRKTPRKKVRRLEHGNCDPVDQEYIAAAATTLCFLMSQKIDSLFDTRHEPKLDANNGDYEPYDCYASQPAAQPDAERSGSRKRSYMHFITEQQEDYASYDPAHGEPSSYTIEGSKLCS